MKRKLLICGLMLAGIAQAQIQSQNFEGATLPQGWTVQITGPGNWSFGSSIPPFTGNPTFASNAAIFNDDALGGESAPSIASLLSPAIDVSGYNVLNASFDYYLNEFSGNGTFKAEAFDGTVWHQLLFRDTDQVTMANASYDVTAYKNPNFQMRFTFDDEGGWSWGAAVDNFVLTGTLASIEQHKNSVAVYPNPTNGVLNFSTDADVAFVAVYNLSGQKVLETSLNPVDVSSLARGAYFAKATLADGRTGTVRFLKN